MASTITATAAAIPMPAAVPAERPLDLEAILVGVEEAIVDVVELSVVVDEGDEVLDVVDYSQNIFC